MYKCETCGASFEDQATYEKHMDDKVHRPECETCRRTFGTWSACDQHMDDTDHWAPRYDCQTCSREFFSQSAADQHMTAVGHWSPRVPCETCNMTFPNKLIANLHMTAMSHFKNYCRPCGRRFQSEHSLQMHLVNSKIHQADVVCPFCKLDYTSASGLIHHLEQGSCPDANILNRETIFRIVHERDSQGVITNKQIDWHKEDSSQNSKTTNAFNGSFWECYLCHLEFGSATALGSHLSSPFHKQTVYHCPNSDDKCVKEFTTLAALFNHLESAACSCMGLEKVQKMVESIFQSWKPIDF
ncbi:zinc finger protein [Aspergillus flavus]|nr:zinc finger protein [Aspergillus flavus]